MLPPVFAIYRADSESFQLLQPEISDDGKVVKLRPWARPTYRTISDEERKNDTIQLWLKGQEWYVVPTYSTDTKTPTEYHRVTIHDQSYTFWTLRHVLLWSNYITHARRHTTGLADWMNAPRIPILEFSSKLIYPRTELPIYPRWVEAKPHAVERESLAGRAMYKDFTMGNDKPTLYDLPDESETDHIHIHPSELRIRTPREDDETFWHTEEELTSCSMACLAPKAKKRSWSDVSDLIEEESTKPCDDPSLCVRSCALASVTLFVGGLLWTVGATIAAIF